MTRSEARKNNLLTYQYHMPCAMDGNTERYTATGKCVACTIYANAIKGGRINGVDMRTPEMKAGKFKPQRYEKWCREMSLEMSEKVKRGLKRKKAMEANSWQA